MHERDSPTSFLLSFFIKRHILVLIYVHIWKWFRILSNFCGVIYIQNTENRFPAVKNGALFNPYYWHARMHGWFFASCPFLRQGKSFKIFKNDSPLSSVTPHWNNAGSSDSLNKQYWESQLYALNDSPEFLHIIHTFITHSYIQCRKLQLSVFNSKSSKESLLYMIAGSQSKIAIISSNLKKTRKAFGYQGKGLGRADSLKNQRQRKSWTVSFYVREKLSV